MLKPEDKAELRQLADNLADYIAVEELKLPNDILRALMERLNAPRGRVLSMYANLCAVTSAPEEEKK